MQVSRVSAPVASSRRPIPMVGRRDLVVDRVDYQGVGYWVVKDPVALKYFRLHQEQYHILTQLDGRRNLEELRDDLQRAFPTARPQLSDVQQLIVDLHRKGLAIGEKPGQAETLIRQRREAFRKRCFAALQNILFIRFPGWDPENTLARLYPLCRWMFHPAALIVAALTILASWLWVGIRFHEFERALPAMHQFFGWPNLLSLWLIMGAAKIVHELAHGLACRRFGGECHEIGVALLVFSPCLYCDVSDSWILRSKWQRIAISAAGMAVEVLISALALFGWWMTQPGLLHHLLFNTFLVTAATTVLFNANPLMKYDGYYILCDWLEIPNLRARADRLLKETFARCCLGIELPPDPFAPQSGRAWFVAYSIAAALYRWFVLFSIVFVLHGLLKPIGLQNLGILLAVFSAATLIVQTGWQIGKVIRMPRVQRMSYRRAAASLLVAAVVVVAALKIPLPLYVQSPFHVEPLGVHHVYTSVPGVLHRSFVRPGQRVKQGDVLFELRNFSKEDQYQRLRTARDVQQVEVSMYQVLDQPAQEQLARATLAAIEEQLAEYEQQLRQLTVVAPCDGVVVAPPEIPPAPKQEAEVALPRWHGTPLDERNVGSFLPSRTHLLSIAPEDRLQGVLVIDQLDRNDYQTGQQVKLKSDHWPGKLMTGVIRDVSQRHLEEAPPQLTTRHGGSLPTTTAANGEERLASVAYQATVLLDAGLDAFRPGMRGRARFVFAQRTAGEWLWRAFRRTFHFRL